MTRAEQTSIIIGHIEAELSDKQDVAERIGLAYANWFQALVQPPPSTPVEETQLTAGDESPEEEAA